MAIKPGFFNIFCKSYTFDMIADYFIYIKNKKIIDDNIFENLMSIDE